MDYCHARRRQEYIKIQSKKEKANHERLANKMDEAEGRTRKIETELNAYNNEITYWKKAAFARVLMTAKKKIWRAQHLQEFC